MPKVRADKRRTAHVFNSKWRSNDVVLGEEADFHSLLLSERVLKGLKKSGFKKPSPIQLETIPFGRYGKDLFIQAKSGTGKTLVFTIVALEMLKDIKCPQVLVIAPTREIADQIREVITSVGVGFKNLICCSFIGGMPMQEDRDKGHSCQIAVGTPGRVTQLIAEGVLPTNSIRLFVLDEADVLLSNNSFASTIMDIFRSLPKEKQVIATSATYPGNIKKFVSAYFRDPYETRLTKENLSLLGTIHYEQEVQHSPAVILAYTFKVKEIEKILKTVKFTQCLVFCNALTMVELLCKDIKKLGFTVTYISSNKEQRDRLKAIDALKHFKCKILICSDLTSRGIDAENVDLIINFDCPRDIDTYLHRVGRAGRYGARGVAITFKTEAENILFRRFQKDANFRAHNLPDPLIRDLINFEPDDSNDYETSPEDFHLEQNGHTDYKDNDKTEINSSKDDAESTVSTVIERKESLENSNIQNETGGKVESMHSKFEFLNEMKGDKVLTPPAFDENVLSRKADSVKDGKKKTSTDAVRMEAEENVNLELLVSKNQNNHSDDIKIKEIDSCSSKELDHSSYMNKILVENANNCEKFETKFRKKLLQDPNHFQNTYEEINLLTEQTGIVKETASKQVNSTLSETNNENHKAEGSAYSCDITSHWVSKFIHDNMENCGHSLSKEKIIESNQGISCKPFGIKKIVTQNDINILRSNNDKFFCNVFANYFHNKENGKKNSFMMNTDENNLVKDHSQLQNIDGNLSNKDEEQFNTIFEVSSSEKTSLKDLFNKSVERGSESKESNYERNEEYDDEKSKTCGKESQESSDLKVEGINSKANEESSDLDTDESSNKTSGESNGLEAKETDYKANEESSDLDTDESSNKTSGESSDLETDESSNETSEECTDLETEESSQDSSEESSSDTESSSIDVSDSDSEQSSEFEHASSKSSCIPIQNERYKNMKNKKKEVFKVKQERFKADDSHSKKKCVKGNIFCSSSSSCSSLSNSAHKRKTQKPFCCYAKANAIPRHGRKDEQDRKTNCKSFSTKSSPKPFYAASTSHYARENYTPDICCGCQHNKYPNHGHSSLSNSVLERETRKPFCCYAKANVIPRHSRKGEQDRKTNCKSFSTKFNPKPFCAVSTSNYQENYSPQICCCCQHIKYPNYEHSSLLNSAQYDCQCCRPANQHFYKTAVNLGDQDYLHKMWYQIFYNQYFWIKRNAFHMSNHY